MGGCLARELPRMGLLEWLALLIQAVTQKMIFAFSSEQEDTQREVSRAAINQQAEMILDTYGNSILQYAYTYLRNMSDAEEVLQDTLLQFLKTAPVFESREHEKAWLLRVAANLSKNRIRYNAVRKTDELQEELVAEQREDLSFVWDAVKSLPEKYREAVHPFYREWYSTRQIAAILGKNEATVRTDLHRGRAKLKELLQEEYDFEETV